MTQTVTAESVLLYHTGSVCPYRGSGMPDRNKTCGVHHSIDSKQSLSRAEHNFCPEHNPYGNYFRE